MTLAETVKAVKKECTDEQNAKIRVMGFAKIDAMMRIAQSMGVKAAISLYL